MIRARLDGKTTVTLIFHWASLDSWRVRMPDGSTRWVAGRRIEVLP